MDRDLIVARRRGLLRRSRIQHPTAKIPSPAKARSVTHASFIHPLWPLSVISVTNNLAPHQPQPTGAIAVVHAFLARLLAMLRSVGYRNELQRQLRGLFGARLRFVATRHERLAGAPH